MNRQPPQGFTIVELLVVCAIVGMLMTIATPYFVRYARASRRSACITNMKRIEAAVTLAKMSGVVAPTASDIIGPASHLKTMPVCPNNRAPYTEIDPPACPSDDETHVMTPGEETSP